MRPCHRHAFDEGDGLTGAARAFARRQRRIERFDNVFKALEIDRVVARKRLGDGLVAGGEGGDFEHEDAAIAAVSLVIQKKIEGAVEALLAAAGRLEAGADLGAVALDEAIEQFGKDFCGIREVILDMAEAQTGTGGDAARGKARIAFVEQQGGGRFEDGLAAGRAFFGGGGALRHGRETSADARP